MLISLKLMKQIVIVPQRLKKLDQRKFDAIPKFYKYGFLIKKKMRIFYTYLFKMASPTVDFYSS